MSTNPGQYCVRLPDGDELLVDLSFDDGQYLARIDGVSHRLSLRPGANGDVEVVVDDKTYQIRGSSGATTMVGETTQSALGTVTAVDAGQRQLKAASRRPSERAEPSRQVIRSPLTGLVVDVCVEDGTFVQQGQTLAVIEAMKMENRITAPCDGRVVEIAIDKGATIRLNHPLLTLLSD